MSTELCWKTSMKPDNMQASRNGDRASNTRMRPPRLLLYLVLVASLDNIIHLNLWLTKSFGLAARQSSDESSHRKGLNDRTVAASISNQTYNSSRVVLWSDHHERQGAQSSASSLGKEKNNYTMELSKPPQKRQQSHGRMPQYAWNNVVHDGRFSRFPSVETRVKLYMSNWYAPPCGNNFNATTHYRFLSEDRRSQRSVLVRELMKSLNASNSGYRVVKIVSEIGDDVALIEPGMLHDLNLPHAGYRADVLTTLLPLIDSTIDETPPILMQFGDRVSLHIAGLPNSESFSLPYFRKCRPVFAKGELERITSPRCYGREERPRHESPTRLIPVHEPIIWKLDSHRLLDPIQEVSKVDLPWRRKIGKAIFRGALTGHAFRPSSHLRLQRHHAKTDREYCNAIDRCLFVLQNGNSSLVDARLTSLLDKRLNSTIEGVPLLGKKMDLQELLRYKVLIMLEGNDVSSGLRWALRSNSLVMMPPPTFTSWAMEELLEPWVHYVPLDPSFNNTESRMQWVLDHDEEAEKIAFRGSLWIKDLLEHPDAEKENTLINKEILERYQRLFVRSDALTLATDSNNVISKTA